MLSFRGCGEQNGGPFPYPHSDPVNQEVVISICAGEPHSPNQDLEAALRAGVRQDCARGLPYGPNGRSDGFLRRSLSAGEVLWTVPDRVI